MAIIQKVNVNGSVYNLATTAYTTCSTAAGTAAKVISMAGLVIEEGVTIHVKFNEGNTSTNPTLTISGAFSSTGTDASTTAIPIMQHGTTHVGNNIGVNSWTAGEIVSLTYDGTNWIADYNTDTTYTFSGGTNKFTYTPAGGTAQEVTITPSISNNITGTGTRTSGYLAKFSGQNTITNGPQLGSDTTLFLNNKGEWSTPSDTHYAATIAVGNAATDKTNEAVTASATGVYLNLVENDAIASGNSHQLEGAGGITIGADANGKITFTGKAGTVTKVEIGDGLVNGTTSSTSTTAIESSGKISIKAGGVTNDMLQNSKITIAGTDVSLGGSFTKQNLLSAIGLTEAVRYIGESSTPISDGGTETPTVTGLSNYTASAGDIVVYDNKEFIWTAAGAWELFGDEGSYATKATTVTNVSWASNTLKQTINGTTSDIVSISTIKSALNLSKSDFNLDNVTNHAQVTSLQWDTTNKRITYKVSEGTATNVVAFAAGSSDRVKLTAAANKLTIEAEDTRVEQTALAYNGTNANQEYCVLFKNTGNAYATETAGVKFASTENKRVTINPSTGTLTAANLVGALRASDVKTALSTSSSSTAMKFLHESGAWKTLAIDVSQTASTGSVAIAEVPSGTATLKIYNNIKITYS